MSFLDVGAIVKEGFTVRVITTAASLWIVAGISMAVGAGRFDAALLATLLAIVALLSLGRLRYGLSRASYHRIEVLPASGVDVDAHYRCAASAGGEVPRRIDAGHGH